MRIPEAIVVMALATGACSAAGQQPDAVDTMARFVGDWRMDLKAHVESFGERAGQGVGTMSCQWGPQHSWVDCKLDAEYNSFGAYYMKLVLHRTAEPGVIGTFVTNSFGGGRLYLGRQESDNKLVFSDAWIDPSRSWQRQRITYTLHDNDRISFMIDVSDDGLEYLPHSSGEYRRL